MKTVGTITFHESINYGALLQAYALQKILMDLGFKSEIIDYRNPDRGLANLSGSRRAMHFLWHNTVKRLLVGAARQKNTKEFCRKHMKLSAKTFNSREALHTAPPIYDAYITGSDQVWNPRNNSRDSSFFLTFAPPGKKRISYAASFGVAKLQAKDRLDYATWLNGIDSLSVRESEGREIVAELTGRETEIVLDPTLLLLQERWREIATPRPYKKPYILCYYMPGDKKVNKSITTLALHVARLKGWDVVSIGQKEYMSLNPFKKSVFDAGPSEFLGLVQNATFVITNSFHGVAFSINYRKPFFVPVNRDLPPETALSSRITSLLSILGLNDRLVPAGDSTPTAKALEICYEAAGQKLNQERKRSLNFLKRALKEAGS